MSATLAFLHHASAFVLVAVVMAELVLLQQELTLNSARSILRLDAVYGLSALMILAVGFLRVFYTEKGSDYYFDSAPFLAKVTVFALVGLLSIYPTVQFMSWRKVLRQEQLPVLDAGKRRTLRLVIHIELVLLFAIMLFAALMARGIGFVGP